MIHSFLLFLEREIYHPSIDYKIRGEIMNALVGSVTFQRNSLPHSAGDPELLQDIRGRAPDERPVPRNVLTVIYSTFQTGLLGVIREFFM